MSMNRLFLYDPETNSAVCIAKGYSTGWSTSGDSSYINKFFEGIAESASGSTRLVLKTEVDMPKNVRFYWQEK